MFEFNSDGDLEDALTTAIGDLPITFAKGAELIADVLTNNTRKYIPASHRLAPGQKKKSTSTGRLWSSWGIGPVITDNPDYSDDDRIREVEVNREGSSLSAKIEVGTTVRYVNYVNDGHPKNQDRVAYHFIEKGRLEAESLAIPVIEQAFLPFVKGQGRSKAKDSLQASSRRRNVIGRFAPGKLVGL